MEYNFHQSLGQIMSNEQEFILISIDFTKFFPNGCNIFLHCESAPVAHSPICHWHDQEELKAWEDVGG